ncbi:helix-turn-helix domain-containing protein [Micromonospora sp. M12]
MRRNRAKVLAAAEIVLGEQGLTARMDEIARRAGVGVGTVYRHFATKEALYAAIVSARVDLLLDEAARLRVAAEPQTGFFRFFAQVVADAARKKTLTDALHSAGIDVKAGQADQRTQMREALADLCATPNASAPSARRRHARDTRPAAGRQHGGGNW